MWHPEKFLQLSLSELSSLPRIRRQRDTLEKLKKEEAQAHNLKTHYAVFHGRLIANNGKSEDRLRKTWVSSETIVNCLQDFDVRLIDTSEHGSQARYKLEFRLNWANDANELAPDLVSTIAPNVRLMEHVSIRQLWTNPLLGTSETSSVLSAETPVEVVNLVIGPFDSQENRRQTHLKLDKKHEIWWITF